MGVRSEVEIETRVRLVFLGSVLIICHNPSKEIRIDQHDPAAKALKT